MRLIQLHENIWTVPDALAVLGIIQLNTRMTIIQLSNGGLWIHSPVPWTEALDHDLRTLGQIEFIVAPSCFHHMFVGSWKEHHPQARICAPHGLKNKRPDLQITHTLQSQGTTLWSEIDCIEIQGMPFVQEHLFFHKESKTLLVADLFFFLPNAKGFTSFYAWLNGVKHRMATPLLFKSAIRDRAAFRASLESLRTLSKDVQQASLCHHLVITTSTSNSESEHIQQGDVPQLIVDALDAL